MAGISGLGGTSESCIGAVIEAMRDQIRAGAADATSGQALAENLDKPEVRGTLAPLGEAVYRILTQHARPVADASTDPAFWQWVADLQARVTAMAAWQQAVAKAFANWVPSSAADQALMDAVTSLPSPPSAPARAPAAISGKII